MNTNEPKIEQWMTEAQDAITFRHSSESIAAIIAKHYAKHYANANSEREKELEEALRELEQSFSEMYPSNKASHFIPESVCRVAYSARDKARTILAKGSN